MTIEEAIKILKEQQNEFNEHWVDYAGVNEAYNMAIEALKKVDKIQTICDKVKSGNPEEIKDLNFSETFVGLFNMVANKEVI